MANLIVGVKSYEDDDTFDRKIAELRQLGKALGLDIDYEMIQNLDKINDLSYVGSGKMIELKDFIISQDIQYVIFNDELTARQYNYLSDALQIDILDRTSLILAIFEKRAHTKEAILQVEIAKLNYQLPRLVGQHQDIIGWVRL